MQLPVVPPGIGSRLFDVVGCGQNSLDLVAVVPAHPAADSHAAAERILRLAGGEVATAVIACARLSAAPATSARSAVTRPARWPRPHSAVKAWMSRTRHADAPNRFAIILVDHAGHRTVIWHRDPAMALPPESIGPEAAAGRVLLLDASDPEASTAAARHAREAGTPTVLDIDAFRPGVSCLLNTVDVIIASEPFFAAYAPDCPIGDALRQVSREFTPAAVIATLGEAGSRAFANGREIRTPAFAVPVVDSTGAGDAFRGGFAASWLRLGPQAELETILVYASAIAGLNCRAVGAQAGLPTWPEVEQLVTEQGYGRSK